MISRDLQIVQGDDYADADGRAFSFSAAGAGWPDAAVLDDATFAASVRAIGADAPAITATPTYADGTLKLEFTAAQTTPLAVGVNAYLYDVHANVSGRRITLVRGAITVLGDV